MPLIPDKLLGKIGIAYPGSNPSFEIKFPQNNLPSNIASIDLEDKDGIIFPNILFNVTKIFNSTDKLILSLTIPDNVSSGILKVRINFADSRRLTGLVAVVDFLNLIKGLNGKGKTVGKPQITQITTLKKRRDIVLNVLGNNFVGSENVNSNTTITLFPADLNVSIKLQSVSKNGKNLVLKLNLLDGFEKSARSVISISTPRGIVSVPLVIKK